MKTRRQRRATRKRRPSHWRGLQRPKVLLLMNMDSSWSPAERREVRLEGNRLTFGLRNVGNCVSSLWIKDVDLTGPLSKFNPDEYVVFNWCEEIPGITHAEALVAGTLQSMRFTFTGASTDVLNLCYNKPLVKQILRENKVPTPRWFISTSPDVLDWRHFPAIVKPAHEHCSMGVTPESVVLNPEELTERISFILRTFNQPALIEEFIDGREFHVSIWGNRKIEILPPAEMDFSTLPDIRDRLCTYDAKCNPDSYLYQNIQTILPAQLTQQEQRKLNRICRKAYQALGCRDYGRIDLRLRNGIFYVLDINPNADISKSASMAEAASHLGHSYGSFADHIVALAAARHPLNCRDTVTDAPSP